MKLWELSPCWRSGVPVSSKQRHVNGWHACGRQWGCLWGGCWPSMQTVCQRRDMPQTPISSDLQTFLSGIALSSGMVESIEEERKFFWDRGKTHLELWEEKEKNEEYENQMRTYSCLAESPLNWGTQPRMAQERRSECKHDFNWVFPQMGRVSVVYLRRVLAPAQQSQSMSEAPVCRCPAATAKCPRRG